MSAEVRPLRSLIESLPASGLTEVSFALLDSPLAGNLVSEQRHELVAFPCGQFDIKISAPMAAHMKVRNTLGPFPHVLSESASMTGRNGQSFNSDAARIALDTVHTTLSFVAGGWVGITLVEAASGPVNPWFRWGTTQMNDTALEPSWYDPQRPEWLQGLCDAFLKLKSNEEMWEPVQTALYWYVRSNARGAGFDSSLILSQCALELLSWFIIVKKTGALSDEGYGQLGSTSEKLRLALTLLEIPRQIPAGLEKLVARQKEWKDVADCVVQARNYLVHPTQSRSGKRRARREYPWHELWIAAQWLLELVILRLLGYAGNYRNRTRVRDFDRIERVPWG